MNRLPKFIASSLAGKLIFALILFIICGGAVAVHELVHNEEKHLMDSAVRYTTSYSNHIKKSVRHAMLVFHRDFIQKTVDSLAPTEDIKQIRIFNGLGKIVYSSKHDEIGKKADKNTFPCMGCHAGAGKIATQLSANAQKMIHKSNEGYRVLTFIDPIYNEPACYSAACHVHSSEQKVLGILKTDFSLASVDSSIQKQTMETTVFAMVFFGAIILLLYAVINYFILKPTATISKAMTKVSEGDLNQTITIQSHDELGLLARTFNAMTADLKSAREKMENWTYLLEFEIEKRTAELKKSQDRLIEAEKHAAMGRLTSDLAHEIRNPLSTIGGFARRLKKHAAPDKGREYAEIIVTETDKLEAMVNHILVLSHYSELNLQRQDIKEIVAEVIDQYKEICSKQTVEIKVEMPEVLPLLLVGREELKEAIGNILANAINSMPSGGVLTISATQEVLHDVPFLVIQIADTGHGIPEERLRQIFEPFYSTQKVYAHGKGLGLLTSRKIIEEHGGFISASSMQGQGAVFSLHFPLQSEEDESKVKCWEYMKCGRDKDGSLKCPAYPYFGRACWAVAGTLCNGKPQGAFAIKSNDCRKCNFYQQARQ